MPTSPRDGTFKNRDCCNNPSKSKRLFLVNDYISATVLAGAAQQILRDICKSRGIESTINKISSTSGNHSKVVHDLVTDVYNKMKHANKDPQELVKVSEGESRMLMTLAATDLMRLNEIKSKKIAEFLDFVKTIKSS